MCVLCVRPFFLGQVGSLRLHEHVLGGADRIRSRPDVRCFELESQPPTPTDLRMRRRARVIRRKRVVLRDRRSLRLNTAEHTVDHVPRRARVTRSCCAEDEIDHLWQRRDQGGLPRRDVLCVPQRLRWAPGTWASSSAVLSGHLNPDAISTARQCEICRRSAQAYCSS
jgi:hypothetical protein